MKDEWVESGRTRIKPMRGVRCWERTSLRYRPDQPTDSPGGSLLMTKWTYAEGLTPSEGVRQWQVLRREGAPPAARHGGDRGAVGVY
jgi:hypothetical protein